jgi:hypothetical protein
MFGRNPKLTAHPQRDACKWLQAGYSARSIAKFHGVHRARVPRCRLAGRLGSGTLEQAFDSLVLAGFGVNGASSVAGRG